MLIVEASFIGEARLRADVAMIPGIDQHFVEGYELDLVMAANIPNTMIGRLLTEQEAKKLLARLERLDPIPKRPPAPSVRRPAKRRPRRSA